VEDLPTGFFIGTSVLGRESKLSFEVCLPAAAGASPKYYRATKSGRSHAAAWFCRSRLRDGQRAEKHLAGPQLNVYRLKPMGAPAGSEIERFDEKLRAHLPFAFSRFGEGELRILDGHSLQRREYTFLAGQPEYESLREQLRESFTYRSASYYIGVAPEIAQAPPFGPADYLRFRRESGQAPAHIWSANIFVNQNHQHFLQQTCSLFSEYETLIVCSESARVDGLPFEVHHEIRGAAHNAWFSASRVQDEMLHLIHRRIGILVLVMLGPLSTILARLGSAQNPRNTYVDIGSPLDLQLFGRPTRQYLRNAMFREGEPGETAATSSNQGRGTNVTQSGPP
jgi:hypothetical protein